jgi:DNA polymerase elongation subunit (family B)
MTATTSLQFQILGSSAKDVEDAYQITIFGATAEGKSVSLDVTGFSPFFFIEIPDAWTPKTLAAYKQYLLKTLKPTEQKSVTLTSEKHRSFWDFTNNRMFNFLKVETRAKRLWTKLRNVCQNAETCLPTPIKIGGKTETLRIYEANIDPILRFFHVRELKPAGWLAVSDDHWDVAEDATTRTAIQATAEYDHVHPAPADVQLTSAPLKIMSWDIECTSSHGDFPLATKTWRKPAREIVAANLTEWTEVESAIRLAVTGKGPLSQIYLGQGVGGPGDLTDLASAWTDISLDDETAIDQIDALLSRHLPPPEGDPIIQIGSVLYVNGKAERKDIFVLGSCTRLPGATTHTHSFKTEADMIRAWCKLIETIDPDIMVGYNIFGFDDKYLWDRATVTRCTTALCAFSRCADKRPELQEKFLSSSAMGDNTFYVITGDGRLHIDLLAYVRRNAVLDSYSLDNVTATFMSGTISKPPAPKDSTTWTIATKSTKGTTVGRYVVLMDEENDVIGDKLEIIAVEPKALHVRMPDGGEALRDHALPPMRWSQSKDDVDRKSVV